MFRLCGSHRALVGVGQWSHAGTQIGGVLLSRMYPPITRRYDPMAKKISSPHTRMRLTHTQSMGMHNGLR